MLSNQERSEIVLDWFSYERTVPCPADLATNGTDEELLDWVKRHYFTQQDLAEAERIGRERGYEAAIAHLTQVGQETHRASGEPVPPRLFITIPGGKVLVMRPGTSLNSLKRAFDLGLGSLALLILPELSLTVPPLPQPKREMVSLWEGLNQEETPLPRETVVPHATEK